MKFLIKILLIAVVLVVGYNYFFGTDSEKAQSEKIVSEIKDLGQSVKDLVVSEKEKYENGKYDKAIEKISLAYQTLDSTFNNSEGSGSSMLDVDLQALMNQVMKLKDSIQSDGSNSSMDEKLQSIVDELKQMEKEIQKK